MICGFLSEPQTGALQRDSERSATGTAQRNTTRGFCLGPPGFAKAAETVRVTSATFWKEMTP
jgi:hypothetical protein